jgi:CBS domain-containing protein
MGASVVVESASRPVLVFSVRLVSFALTENAPKTPAPMSNVHKPKPASTASVNAVCAMSEKIHRIVVVTAESATKTPVLPIPVWV